jgi:hypothetical protein
MSTVYQINKGVNRSLEFKGIRAQYIIYLGAGLVLLLLLFVILYVEGCNTYLCLGIILPAGAGLMLLVSRFSKRYGEHGLLKKIAKKRLPVCVKSKTSKLFFLSGK